MLVSRLSPFLRMVVVLIVCVTTTTAKGLLNPGLSIGVKSSSPKAILLHPSLTSAHYLETKPMKRRKGARRSKAQTNFAALKNSLLLTDDDDNLAVETQNDVAATAASAAPYARLPQSYQNILPASFYATHTFVPPIKNLYSIETTDGLKPDALEEDSASLPLAGESTRTSNNRDLSPSSHQVNIIQQAGEIISPTKETYFDTISLPALRFSKENALEAAPEDEDEDVEVAVAESENDFKPSSPVTFSGETYYQPASLVPRRTPSLQSETFSSPTQFGVAVTPISVGQDGLKRSNLTTPPRFHINRPPLAPSPTMLLKQNPFLGRVPTLTQAAQIPQTDQLALGGHVHDREAASPTSHSLLYLGRDGPSMPVFSKLRQDLGHMMTGFTRGPLREMTQSLSQPSSNKPVMMRLSNAMDKIMGGHVGDRTFDGFDWVPLIALLVATALILSGLFPTGLNTFGINQGQLVVGRKGRVEDESILDQALGHLESGVMMMGALRHQDDCSLRLACRLGKLAQNSDMLRGQTAEALFQGVHAILPHKYSSFARSFQAVAKEEDLSSCEKECYRCIAI